MPFSSINSLGRLRNEPQWDPPLMRFPDCLEHGGKQNLRPLTGDAGQEMLLNRITLA
jgi:hypothetical protein